MKVVCAKLTIHSIATSISTEPSKGVEEEFIGRVDPVGAAPDADDQVHRDQPGLEEDVEEVEILRAEDADHQRFHQQEIGHEFGHAALDRGPRGGDADRHQEGGEHDQHQGDAVYAERPGEAAEDGVIFGELPLRPADAIGAHRPMQSSSVASVVIRAIQRAPLAPLSRQASAPSSGKREDRREDREASIIAPSPR
jgi:hypothetical protein